MKALADQRGGWRRRTELADDIATGNSRDLQADLDRVDVFINNCTFTDNDPGAPTPDGFTQHALIVLESNANHVFIKDSLFYHNDYDNYNPVRDK